MDKAPFLSVIIPLYNKEKDIVNTLKSLLKQTFTNFEVIVVNDGSTDKSAYLVEQFKDARIKLYSKQNEGVALTRNFGVSKANTDFVCFLDADDYWYANHLQQMVALINTFSAHQWFATAYEKQHRKNFITPMQTHLLKDNNSPFVSVENYFKYSLNDALAWTSAVCFKKSFFETLNGFDASITMGAGEDTDLWLRAALQQPLAFSKNISARHILNSSNRISHTHTLKRTFMDFDKYEHTNEFQPYLKRYLDINRFSVGLQYKLAGEKNKAIGYFNKIDANNLNNKQKVLVKLPFRILKLLYNLKRSLINFNIKLSAFNS